MKNSVNNSNHVSEQNKVLVSIATQTEDIETTTQAIQVSQIFFTILNLHILYLDR